NITAAAMTNRVINFIGVFPRVGSIFCCSFCLVSFKPSLRLLHDVSRNEGTPAKRTNSLLAIMCASRQASLSVLSPARHGKGVKGEDFLTIIFLNLRSLRENQCGNQLCRKAAE